MGTSPAARSTAWTRRGFMGLAGAGLVSAVGGTAAARLPESSVSDATRDADLLPGSTAHAWLRAVYDVVWHGGSSTPTNAARIYCAVSIAMY